MPIEPGFCFETGLKVQTGEVSVRPYPSMMVNPSLVMSVYTSGSSRAPPLAKSLNPGPNRACTLPKSALPTFTFAVFLNRPFMLRRIFTSSRTTTGFFRISSKMARRRPANNCGTPSMTLTFVSFMHARISGPFRLFRIVTFAPTARA